jgi:hypothetical protein
MKKELKDFIHLYLGCDIIIQYDGKEIIEKLQSFDVKTLKISSENYVDYSFNVKLSLRLLLDVSDKEWNEIEEKSSIAPDAFGYYGIKDNFLINTPNTRFSWTVVNEILIELRKRSVDVDGLIEAGLAIDSKTLKEKI